MIVVEQSLRIIERFMFRLLLYIIGFRLLVKVLLYIDPELVGISS